MTAVIHVDHDQDYPADYLATILKEVKTIAMVGASSDPTKFSYGVLRVLHETGYDMIPVNPNEAGGEIRGLRVYEFAGRDRPARRHGPGVPHLRCAARDRPRGDRNRRQGAVGAAWRAQRRGGPAGGGCGPEGRHEPLSEDRAIPPVLETPSEPGDLDPWRQARLTGVVMRGGIGTPSRAYHAPSGRGQGRRRTGGTFARPARPAQRLLRPGEARAGTVELPTLKLRRAPIFRAFSEPAADQRLPIDPVGRRSAPAARGQNRRGIDNVAFDSFALQNAVDPEAVQSGLLDGDDGKVPPRPPSRFLLELGQPHEQARHIAGPNRMLRHLLPGAWRQRCDQPGRSAEFQRGKNCGKICLDSGRRIGSVSCNLHGRLQSGWFSNLTLPSAPVAIQTPMGSFTTYSLPVSRRTHSRCGPHTRAVTYT